MDREKLIKQLFVGKITEIIGTEKTTELLKEATIAIDEMLKLCKADVSESKSPTLNDVQRYYYQKHHFDEKGNVMKQYVKKDDDIIHELILGFCKNFYSR